MSQPIHLSEANPPTQPQPPITGTDDNSFPRELIEHIDRLRLILPVISVSVMALNRRDAESHSDIALVLNEHACGPLGREIERVESLLSIHMAQSGQGAHA